MRLDPVGHAVLRDVAMALRTVGSDAARAVTPPTAAVVHRGDVEIYSLAELKKFQKVTEIIGNLTISLSGPKVANHLWS